MIRFFNIWNIENITVWESDSAPAKIIDFVEKIYRKPLIQYKNTGSIVISE